MSTDQDRSGDNNNRQIGYFRHLRVGEQHAGAIMVTNHIGVPIEFKYTEPIACTRLHKILYGIVLEKYLRETVIRGHLGKEVRSEPEFFISPYDEREFLAPLAGREMIAIQRAKVARDEITSDFTRIRRREAIIDLEDGPRLRVAFSTSDDSIQQRMVLWLKEVARTMDVLEPLERVNTALKVLWGDQKRV